MKHYYTGEHVVLAGDITLEENVSVWHNSVLRGDTASIHIKHDTNIQDLCMLHAGEGCPILVEDHVTIGHSAILHGCTIEHHCLIGMGSIIMNHARISHHSIVAAGSLVTEHKEFPPYSLILGSPAKAVRQLTPEEIDRMKENSLHYVAESIKQLQEH